MLPPTEQPTICFAHVAYRLRERFLALATGIESFEVSDGAAPEQRIGEADVLVISGLWRNDLLPRAMPAEGGNHWSEKMETIDVFRREIKVLTFDQYGTIVDMQKGLTEAVTPFLKQKGWDGKPNVSSLGGAVHTSKTQ